MIKRVSNIGIAAKDAEATANTYCQLFGLNKEHEFDFSEVGVSKSILVRVGRNMLEIMEPAEGDVPLRRAIEKRGEGLFQISVIVDDVEKTAKELEIKGAKVMIWRIGEKRDIPVAYINPKYTGGVAFEICTDAMMDQYGVKY